MKIEEVSSLIKSVIDEVSRMIVGKNHVIEALLATILANGHVLIEDYPGLAKTLMAKSIAKVLGCKFKRIQFTPDLLPADITGSNVFNQSKGEFEFRPGPVFANILLADEINRAPPKTQSALLEAMQERQVTVDGITHKLPQPFMVIATQNPIEYEGTYPLPEAQVDRFMVRLRIGYPSKDDEIEILRRRHVWKKDEIELRVLADPMTVIEAQRAVEDVYISEEIMEYIVELIIKTRTHPNVEIGSSPRGTLALMKLSKARAAIKGRDYVLPDDIKTVAYWAIPHRLILRSELWIKGIKPEEIIREVLKKIPVPKVKQ